MKIKPRRNSGTIWLALFLLFMVALFLGLLIYILVKLFPRIKPPPSEDNIAAQVQPAYQSPGPSCTPSFSISFQIPTNVVLPELFMTIQRSTNLVDWTNLYSLPFTNDFLIDDPEPPYPNGFYRVQVWTP